MSSMNPRMTLLVQASVWLLLMSGTLGCSQAGNSVSSPQPKTAAVGSARSPGRTGTVQGQVRWEGPSPNPEIVSVPSGVQRMCGASITQPALHVSPKGGVGNVVIWAEVPALPTADLKARALPSDVLSQVRCVYQPQVLALTVGTELTVTNEDAVLHNIHARDSKLQTLFNFAQPVQRMQNKKSFPAEGVVDVRCDLHPWMRATVRVFSHPTFTVTDADGRYRLDGVPWGSQKIHFWHPRLSEQTFALEVSDLGPAEKDVTWSVVLPK